MAQYDMMENPGMNLGMKVDESGSLEIVRATENPYPDDWDDDKAHGKPRFWSRLAGYITRKGKGKSGKTHVTEECQERQ